ncbi:hypothetical protein Goari_023149 [Gossypium aridum]|uniref:Pentatricopeptide repeat-containing protein n=1 Tax=Gossypium aridum TaxID=34290 RepID=A0A7J8X233_GOSAI|nr:hypothetical protein [Gossypium aridum]
MMEEKGCYPNVVTYTAMIDGFGKAGKINKSLELLEQMGSKGVAPNFITYSVMINHCCIVGLLDKAYELLEEMKQTYWPRHIASYRKVIEGFNKEFIMSLGLLDEVGKSESLPVIPVYRVLIYNFIKAGRLEMALQLHHEIASFSQVPAAYCSTYNALIQSLSLARKVNKAFELYADMTRMGGVPELSTFIHLIKGLITVNKWEEALQLSDSFCQMCNYLLHMDCTLCTLLTACDTRRYLQSSGPIPTPQNNLAGRYNSYSSNLLTEFLQSSAVRDDDRNKKSHHP